MRKDGTRFWASVVLSAVRNEKGELLGFAKVTRDLTSRKRAAEEMQQRARQQTAVAELGLHAVRTTQLPLLLERAVQAAREMLGIEQISIVGADEASDPAHLRFPIHAAEQDAPPYGFLSVAADRAISAGDASFLQAVANVVSAAITRGQMEQQLRAAERAAVEERNRTQQAQEALRVRDEFISVAAHELRTPLTALHLKLQGLERHVRGTGTKEAQRLEAAVRQAERLARLIDRLLDVSRISQGKLEMSREPFDMVELVRQVIDDFREPAAQAQTPLELDAPASLQGSWDRLRMEQVLVNVLSNAVKYGAGKPIRVKLGGDERRVRIEVSDRGIGISSADLDRIFGRFERASSLRHYGGLGLGLYITRHIVEGHGGTISAASTLGEGSTFTVELPRLATAGRVPQARA